MRTWRFAVCTVIVLVLLTLAPLVAAQCPSESGDWLLFKGACYKFYNESEFWYTAEMTCQASSGHLVSIESDHENRLVAKMTLCQDVWIGQYATDMKKLADASSYAWSDENKNESAVVYDRHDFTKTEQLNHKPLVRAMDFTWYNSLYHEEHPFMCKVRPTGELEPKCPSTMRFYQGNCYLSPRFEATFIEANFFCQNHSAHVASVLCDAELRFLHTVDLEVDACELQPMWLGLVKLNPCFPDHGGRELCYQWTDYSGMHLNFPTWAERQPAVDSGEVRSEQDCVIIAADLLYSAKCTDRHHFVCKMPASSFTPGSPAWMALDEPPEPINKSQSVVVKEEPTVTATTEEANASAEVTPAPESHSTGATVTPESTVTPTTEEANSSVEVTPAPESHSTWATVTPGTTDEDKPEATATPKRNEVQRFLEIPSSSVPVHLTSEPTSKLDRNRRSADVSTSQAPTNNSSKKATHTVDPKVIGRTENDAAEERGFPWRLKKLLSQVFASYDTENDSSTKPVRTAFKTDKVTRHPSTPLTPSMLPQTTPQPPLPLQTTADLISAADG